MKINLFKLITENEVEYDERISKEQKDIQILMLILIKFAFVITLIVDCFINSHSEKQIPILYYTIMLEMTLEPLLRCLRGAFENPKEFILSLVIGCTIAGTSVVDLFKLLFNQNWIIAVLCIITSIIMYFIYDWTYNLYLRKQERDCS